MQTYPVGPALPSKPGTLVASVGLYLVARFGGGKLFAARPQDWLANQRNKCIVGAM